MLCYAVMRKRRVQTQKSQRKRRAIPNPKIQIKCCATPLCVSDVYKLKKSKEMGLLFVKQGQGFFQRTWKYVKNPRPADSQI